MSFVDFAQVKAAVSIEDAAKKLGLKLKAGTGQFRAPCPACQNAGERALVITPSKNAAYCWGARKGGDCIFLASHVLQVSAKEAASFLMDGTSQSPESEKAQGGNRTNSAQSFTELAYLESDNEAVEAIGFSVDFAKSFGLGYAPRGVMKGSVAIPMRDRDGTLLGYVACQELTYLAPSFTPNVVALKRPA